MPLLDSIDSLPDKEKTQKSPTPKDSSVVATQSKGRVRSELSPAPENKEYKDDPLLSSGYSKLEIPDSVKFLLLFNEPLRSGVLVDGKPLALNPWQLEVNRDICYGRTRDDKGEIIRERQPTSMHPYKFALCAANGSGKDAYFIAPFALWFICTKIKAKVIITSSSGSQLTSQTEKYISELAREVNQWAQENMGQEIIKIRKRFYQCLLSGSVIYLFATDEQEKAEGHHPLAPGAEMAIIINEAKSVRKEIFDALRRCTGYNYWVDVSSPGEPIGEFFKHFNSWPNKRRVSYFDCPHQSPDEFEEDRRELGEHSFLFRSKWLALFTFVGGSYVVPQEKLENLRLKLRHNLVPHFGATMPIRIGIDIALSANGDETCIAAWRGNNQLEQWTCRIQDATVLAIAIHTELKRIGIDKKHPYIFADDGGVGRAVIDILNRMGYQINRVLNQTTAKVNKQNYKNRGAQLWYKFSRLICEGALIFKNVDDDKLFSQIASRKFKESEAGMDKLQLESKKEMISAGFPSPDRADANVLAFTDVGLDTFLDLFHKTTHEDTQPTQTVGELMDDIKRNLRRGHGYFRTESQAVVRSVKGSVNALMSRRNNSDKSFAESQRITKRFL